jgi:predicted metalloprotease with PDZ domain
MLLSDNELITYTLSMDEPSSHLFEVKMDIEGINENYVDLILPVWRPGRYFVFDFPSGVVQFNAVDNLSNSLKLKKIDKCTWRIETRSIKKLNVVYKIYANEFDLRTRGLDEQHGFVNGTAVFMYCEKLRRLPLTLKVIPYKDWHVTTGLDDYSDEPNTYTAPDYDHLADCPLEIGSQKDYQFDLDGKKYIISFFGKTDYNIDNLISAMSKVIKTETDFWGKIPFDKYVFMIHCGKQGGGGTEHINSTVLDITPKAFENVDSFRGYLGLVAHEFFHTWNVKQIRPLGLTPYNYTKENYTEELWFAEGGTSYYDGLMVLRSGQAKTVDFFKEIAHSAEEDRRRPGNKMQSLAESSFDAWVKFWKGTPQRYNMECDYYGKGADVFLILDLEIRHRTNNNRSLDDILRTMYDRFPQGKGYINSDIINICGELTGSSFIQFFDDYVYGTKAIEWDKYLSYAGLELITIDSTSVPVIGLELQQSDGKIFVKNVMTGSAADSAKFVSGDEIITADGDRVNYDDLNDRLQRMKIGEKINLGIFRKDKYIEIKLSVTAPKVPNYVVLKTSTPDDKQKIIYEDWLKVKW